MTQGLTFLLASLAKKRAALRLHNSLYFFNATIRTQFVRAIVDAMFILVAAFRIKRVAISSVRQGRSLVLDRSFQYQHHLRVDCLPARFGNSIAASLWVHAGQM